MEIAHTVNIVDYMYKYIYKGSDFTFIRLEDSTWDKIKDDEIKQYEYQRYLSAAEATWRLFSYHVNGERYPSVKTVPVHRHGMDMVSYDDEREVNDDDENCKLHANAMAEADDPKRPTTDVEDYLLRPGWVRVPAPKLDNVMARESDEYCAMSVADFKALPAVHCGSVEVAGGTITAADLGLTIVGVAEDASDAEKCMNGTAEVGVTRVAGFEKGMVLDSIEDESGNHASVVFAMVVGNLPALMADAAKIFWTRTSPSDLDPRHWPPAKVGDWMAALVFDDNAGDHEGYIYNSDDGGNSNTVYRGSNINAQNKKRRKDDDDGELDVNLDLAAAVVANNVGGPAMENIASTADRRLLFDVGLKHEPAQLQVIAEWTKLVERAAMPRSDSCNVDFDSSDEEQNQEDDHGSFMVDTSKMTYLTYCEQFTSQTYAEKVNKGGFVTHSKGKLGKDKTKYGTRNYTYGECVVYARERATVCRMRVLFPRAGEDYYLRMVLSHRASPILPASLRVADVMQADRLKYSWAAYRAGAATFQAAAHALGLIDGVREHIACFNEVCQLYPGDGRMLRQLFVLLVVETDCPAAALWNLHGVNHRSAGARAEAYRQALDASAAPAANEELVRKMCAAAACVATAASVVASAAARHALSLDGCSPACSLNSVFDGLRQVREEALLQKMAANRNAAISKERASVTPVDCDVSSENDTETDSDSGGTTESSQSDSDPQRKFGCVAATNESGATYCPYFQQSSNFMHQKCGRFFDILAKAVTDDEENGVEIIEVNTVADDSYEVVVNTRIFGRINDSAGVMKRKSQPFQLELDPAKHTPPVVQRAAHLPVDKLRLCGIHNERQSDQTEQGAIRATAMFAYEEGTGLLSLHDGTHRINSATTPHAVVDDGKFILNRCNTTGEGVGVLIVADNDDRTMVSALLGCLRSIGIANDVVLPWQMVFSTATACGVQYAAAAAGAAAEAARVAAVAPCSAIYAAASAHKTVSTCRFALPCACKHICMCNYVEQANSIRNGFAVICRRAAAAAAASLPIIATATATNLDTRRYAVATVNATATAVASAIATANVIVIPTAATTIVHTIVDRDAAEAQDESCDDDEEEKCDDDISSNVEIEAGPDGTNIITAFTADGLELPKSICRLAPLEAAACIANIACVTAQVSALRAERFCDEMYRRNGAARRGKQRRRRGHGNAQRNMSFEEGLIHSKDSISIERAVAVAHIAHAASVITTLRAEAAVVQAAFEDSLPEFADKPYLWNDIYNARLHRQQISSDRVCANDALLDIKERVESYGQINWDDCGLPAVFNAKSELERERESAHDAHEYRQFLADNLLFLMNDDAAEQLRAYRHLTGDSSTIDAYYIASLRSDAPLQEFSAPQFEPCYVDGMSGRGKTFLMLLVTAYYRMHKKIVICW